MAKIDRGLIGIRGKVRDLVFKKTKFGTTVSSFDADVYKNKQWTSKQSAARAKFSGLCKLAQVFRKANDVGFALEMKYTSQSCFLRHNFTAVEISSDGSYIVDYERICMSYGTLPMLNNLSVIMFDNRIKIDWHWKKGMAGDSLDKVAVMLYCPDFKDGGINDVMGDSELSGNFVHRNSCKAEMVVPDRWKGLKVYAYAFAFDAEGRTSNSQFVGSFMSDSKIVERRFEIKEKANEEMVFVGVEQRNEEIDGLMKNCFVIKFRDDDELKEEILVEPTTAADFESIVLNGVRQPSTAELVMRRMGELIKEVNPQLFEDKYRRGEEFRANSWNELCRMVADAVNGV